MEMNCIVFIARTQRISKHFVTFFISIDYYRLWYILLKLLVLFYLKFYYMRGLSTMFIFNRPTIYISFFRILFKNLNTSVWGRDSFTSFHFSKNDIFEKYPASVGKCFIIHDSCMIYVLVHYLKLCLLYQW